MKIATNIAVVILNWNGAQLFDEFLPSVIENTKTPHTEIIVADNNSTDNSLEVLKSNFPTVKIIKLKMNYGFAEGYNQALKQIEARYFVLLNSDVKVTKNWLEPCISMLETESNLAAVQPKILSYKNPHEFEYAGAAGGFIDKYGYPFCRGRILNRVETDSEQYNQSSEIFWATGACMFIKSDLFKQAGGFDADFWAHMEEIDLCWRLKNQGYAVKYQPQSTVYHLGGGTLSYGSPAKIYLNFRNNLFMLFKNLPESKFKRILLSRMILDGVAAVKFILGFDFKEFAAVFKAHISFYKSLSTLRKKRNILLKSVTNNSVFGIYNHSIMWKFFLQNKKTFTELDF